MRVTTNFYMAIAAATVLCCSSAPAPAAESNTASVKAAAAQFYIALNKMLAGDLDPMKKVWSHAEDVNYMGPAGGFQVGWAPVLKNWEAQTAMKLGGKVHPTEMHITAGENLAVVSNYEKGETHANGGVQKISIRVTSIFRKEKGQWKMIGHHTDLLNLMAK